MALIDFNRRPTPRQVREFGLISLVALPLVGWLWGAGATTIGWLALAGLVVAVVGLLAPRGLLPVYVGISAIAMPIGIVVGELVLVLVYFAVFFPMGLAFRLIGRDALQLKLDRRATSYWQEKEQPQRAARYYRQS